MEMRESPGRTIERTHCLPGWEALLSLFGAGKLNGESITNQSAASRFISKDLSPLGSFSQLIYLFIYFYLAFEWYFHTSTDLTKQRKRSLLENVKKPLMHICRNCCISMRVFGTSHCGLSADEYACRAH